MQDIEKLGFDSFFAAQLGAETDVSVARVCGGTPPHVLVHDGEAECAALLGGRAQRLEIAVGDWVVLDEASSPSVVRRVLARRSVLQRQAAGRVTEAQVLAANVDVVLILEALDRAPAPRRLERLVALAWSAGAEPVVLLTKADVHENPAAAELEVTRSVPGVEVHAVVTTDASTVALVSQRLAGHRTGVLVGLSGAGKSTLTNSLLGSEAQRTGAVRSLDRRGRHVTTARRLFVLPSGGALIDGPGLRELALWDSREAVAVTFADITDLAGRCRFRDCRHHGEPGCAVTAAVAASELDAGRVEGYLKLQRELEVHELRREGSLRAEERRFWRPIHRAMRHMSKR